MNNQVSQTDRPLPAICPTQSLLHSHTVEKVSVESGGEKNNIKKVSENLRDQIGESRIPSGDTSCQAGIKWWRGADGLALPQHCL